MFFRTIIRLFNFINKENNQLNDNQPAPIVKLTLDKQSVFNSIEIIDMNRYTISNSFLRIEKAMKKSKPFVFIFNVN